MVALIIIAVSAFLFHWITYKPCEKRKRVPDAADNKRRDKERKAAFKRSIARHDRQTQAERLKMLYHLLDGAQARYAAAAGEKETEKAARQVMSLESQIATTEARIEKDNFTVKYGG